MEPLFFPTPSAFRAWLEAHHTHASELLVGFFKTGSGRPSITWPEAVDEALCVGWIDGVRRGIDAHSYSIRFTPRKAASNWSAVNIRRMAELIAAGRVRPAGLLAFERRSEKRSAIYSYEQRDSAVFDETHEQQFRANDPAWRYFQAQPPSYRRTATYWVMTAKKPETRQRRLAKLIEYSAQAKPIPELDRTPRKKGD